MYDDKFTIHQIKKQHKKYLKKDGFLLNKKVPNLTDDEYKILNEKGFWLSALANQRIAAYTSAQKRFVNVSKGILKGKTIYEEVWVKYNDHINKISHELKKVADLNYRKDKSKIIIKNAIMNGEEHYLKIRKQEIENGYITEDDANQIFEKYSKFMPPEDMTKKIGATEGVPTTCGHDPYR